MTVFRVNIKRDKASVVKDSDPELAKLLGSWSKVTEKYNAALKKHGAEIMKVSREVYTATDKKLKELSKDKSARTARKTEIAELTTIRKQAYDMTNAIKAIMKPY